MTDTACQTNELSCDAASLQLNSIPPDVDPAGNEGLTSIGPKVGPGRKVVATPERVAAAVAQLQQEDKAVSTRAVMRITGGSYSTVSRALVDMVITKGPIEAAPHVPDALAKQWNASLDAHTQEIRLEANQRINDLLGQLEELQSAYEERDAQLNEQQHLTSEAASQRDELRGRLTGESEAHERTRQDLQTCRQRQSLAETAQASLETEREFLYGTVQELQQCNEGLTREHQSLQKRHEERGIELVKVKALLDHRLSPSSTMSPAVSVVSARTPQPYTSDDHDDDIPF